MIRHLAAPLLALALVTATAPAVWAEAMAREDFEDALDQARTNAREAVEHYKNGDEEAALDDAREVRERFTFDEDGASPARATHQRD
jgi:hypothetical protein